MLHPIAGPSHRIRYDDRYDARRRGGDDLLWLVEAVVFCYGSNRKQKHNRDERRTAAATGDETDSMVHTYAHIVCANSSCGTMRRKTKFVHIYKFDFYDSNLNARRTIFGVFSDIHVRTTT